MSKVPGPTYESSRLALSGRLPEVVSALTLWLAASAVFGAVPRLINFQGILRDGSGNPVAGGSYSVTFKIYDDPAAGNLLWSEKQSVTTDSGPFAVLLGAINPVPDSVFTDTLRWLGITASPDANEMSPRQQLVLTGDIYRVRPAEGGGITGDSSVSGKVEVKATSPSKKSEVVERSDISDTLLNNQFGYLRDDDPDYVKKLPRWQIATKVAGSNFFTWAVDRYYFNYPFSRIGFNSWEQNLKTGWEWDVDRFGLNYFFHPYQGNGYFNSARSNGYSFFESVPFAIGGSLMWEYFAENTLPAYNDIINTPVTGAFLGEILYRLSSNVLDDRTTGMERVLREVAAAFLNPSRASDRLTQGKLKRATPTEVYQKEPLNITLSTGWHWVNDGTRFGTGSKSITANVDLNYGSPFEKRFRKPFDFFKLRVDLSSGVGRKVLNSINGYGILFGKNVQTGGLEMLAGLFQHYNFWDNKTFELATIAFGGGIISKWPVFRNSTLYSNIHIGIVPFGGNSNRFGPDTSQFRDYNYGGGLEAELENTFNLGNRASATFIGYYYWIHTYEGFAGDHYMAIIKPRVVFRFYNNLNIGFEHLVYYSDRYPRDFPDIHLVRTEQRIYLLLNLGDSQHGK